ncbi:GlxA family transcriptional regulator [Rhizobium leguminosarum]|uniref:GlxA family transcriptional regulator n=1 Tax=Rhizobium leguminosarum TaxID=384 RepID=UPI001C924D3A|nr:GlxA family transcriptional regulator [Rhizobium leguminosarum]MBY2924366.1 GlxA family transcriptional regulator [Rhizobium leguminosarum]
MQRIGFVLVPGFQLMYLAALSVFELANVSTGENVYEIDVLSEEGGPVRSSHGLTVNTKAFEDSSFDTVIFGGGMRTFEASSGMIDFARRANLSSRRTASICTGAFVLAQAGLLNGKRATTHWQSARELQQRYPEVKLEEDRIFIIDGNIWTSAGMSAGIDLALGMVEKDFGSELARSVAQNLVLYHRRAGGQSQHSELLKIDAKSDRIQSALDYARKNLKSALSVEELADAAHLSPRQFSRAFRSETGQSPAKAVEHLRLETARLMMEQTRHPIEYIAAETGFADRERMRRAFLRAFGQPPQAIRRSGRPVDETEKSCLIWGVGYPSRPGG